MDFTEYLLKENEKLQKTSLKTTIEKLIDENQQLKQKNCFIKTFITLK